MRVIDMLKMRHSKWRSWEPKTEKVSTFDALYFGHQPEETTKIVDVKFGREALEGLPKRMRREIERTMGWAPKALLIALLLLLPLALAAQEGAGGYYEPRTEETVKWGFGANLTAITIGAIREAAVDRLDLQVAEAEARMWQWVAEDQAEDIRVMRGECLHQEALLRWAAAGMFAMGVMALGFAAAYVVRGMRVRVRKVNL